MKQMDYAAMGMASGAYAEASRAKDGVNQLWTEIQLIKRDINNQKYEREFQKWAEEVIYQFDKTVTAISDYPGNPVTDTTDLASFFWIIEENKLDTSLISGLENKKQFDQTLYKAQKLIDNLKANPQVQEYFHRQEQARCAREQKANDSKTGYVGYATVGIVLIILLYMYGKG